eukprot:358155-Chlamydomonas_euryale.AAC.4
MSGPARWIHATRATRRLVGTEQFPGAAPTCIPATSNLHLSYIQLAPQLHPTCTSATSNLHPSYIQPQYMFIACTRPQSAEPPASRWSVQYVSLRMYAWPRTISRCAACHSCAVRGVVWGGGGCEVRRLPLLRGA